MRRTESKTSPVDSQRVPVAIAQDVTAPDMEFAEELSLLQPLVEDGLVCVEGRVVTATDTGRQVVRVIAAVFDPHTRSDSARFSKAV